jgi:hypothetical protein
MHKRKGKGVSWSLNFLFNLNLNGVSFSEDRLLICHSKRDLLCKFVSGFRRVLRYVTQIDTELTTIIALTCLKTEKMVNSNYIQINSAL